MIPKKTTCRGYMLRFVGAAITSAVRDGEIKRLYFSESETDVDAFACGVGTFHSASILEEFDDMKTLRRTHDTHFASTRETNGTWKVEIAMTERKNLVEKKE